MRSVKLQGDKPKNKASPMMSLLELFCAIDDFCQTFEPTFHQVLISSGQERRQRAAQMSLSEMLTIVVHFHQIGYRNFKTYYLGYVEQYLRGEFPKQLSYTRFIQLVPRLLLALVAYLRHCYGTCWRAADRRCRSRMRASLICKANLVSKMVIYHSASSR